MQTIGRFQLLELLGQGGMAVVYRAYDTTLGREIALKLMAAHLMADSAFYQRFEREARIVAALEHPGIVPIYDYGIDDQRRPYLVMRLLRGGTLKGQRADGRLADADLWPAMRQVAAALDYAHLGHIVHRDIKPVNILFDEKGNAYVSDFGIAKVRDVQTAELTGNAILGTPAYMSPEQFDTRPIDGRSDQYSLAVVLFEVLTGRLPFGGNSANVLMNQHLNERPPDVHTLNPAMPAAVSAVFNRALAKDPAARYPDVTTFVQELEAASYQRVQPAGPGPKLDKEQQQLDGYYQAGLLAYERNDWSAAVAYLGRVVAIDTAYRDAARLRQTALYRLREHQAAAPRPEAAARPEAAHDATTRAPVRPPVAADTHTKTVQAGAGGATAQPAKRRPVNRRLLAVLGVAALVVAAFLYYLLRPTAVVGPTPATETPTEAATATVPAGTTPPPEASVRVVAADEAGARAGGQATELSGSSDLMLVAGQPLRLTGGEGVTELALPDGRRLFLAEGTEIALTLAEAGGIALELETGPLLVGSTGATEVLSQTGARAALAGAGLLGVAVERGSLLFTVACLDGACHVSGARDESPVALRPGQDSLVGGNDRASAPGPANYAPFLPLGVGLIPTPTVTPTHTPTRTVTPTRTAAAPVYVIPAGTEPPGQVVGPGTPNATETIRFSDEDRDGLLYYEDGCPRHAGDRASNGCPATEAPPGPTAEPPTVEPTTVGPPTSVPPTAYPSYP